MLVLQVAKLRVEVPRDFIPNQIVCVIFVSHINLLVHCYRFIKWDNFSAANVAVKVAATVNQVSVFQVKLFLFFVPLRSRNFVHEDVALEVELKLDSFDRVAKSAFTLRESGGIHNVGLVVTVVRFVNQLVWVGHYVGKHGGGRCEIATRHLYVVDFYHGECLCAYE